MKLEPKQLIAKLSPFVKKALGYATFAFVIAVLLVFGFIVLRIRTLVVSEPSEGDVQEKLLASQPVKIDEDAVKRIEQLEDANVQVKALFKQARDNPFGE